MDGVPSKERKTELSGLKKLDGIITVLKTNVAVQPKRAGPGQDHRSGQARARRLKTAKERGWENRAEAGEKRTTEGVSSW